MLFEKSKNYLGAKTINTLHSFAEYTKNLLGSWTKKIKIVGFDLKITTSKNNLYNLINWLANSTTTQYKQLVDIAVIDRPGNRFRFSIVYLLLSHRFNSRISVSTETDELTSLMSITGIYKGANWFEREVWDLFGIYFDKHSDLRRILTDYGFNGHPLRKDFPLTGFIELYFSDDIRRMVYDKVELTQEFRRFTFKRGL